MSKYHARKREGICYTCNERPSSLEINKFGKQSKQCNECRINRAKIYQVVGKVRWQAQKAKAFSIYGPTCKCCGEVNPLFLTLDHVNNDGAKHRREVGKGTRLWQWLEENNYPSGFQVLCFNCNCGRDLNGGICPHVSPNV